jgi:probable HAF family extracellular repeat protein
MPRERNSAVAGPRLLSADWRAIKRHNFKPLDTMRNRNRIDPEGESLTLQWILLGAAAAALVWAAIGTSAAQELPPGGSVPPLRRGTNGQIEIAPPNSAVRSAISRRDAAPAATKPKAASPGTGPNGVSSGARDSGPPPSKPVISVVLTIPKVPDTTRREAIVTAYSGMMSDGSPIKAPGARSTLATAINNSGQIVGSFVHGQYPKHPAFLKTKSDFQSFNVPGASATLPSGINNLGQIVGTFFDNMAHQHGFFRDTNGAVTVLDLPGAMITFPNGINDLSQIVGSYLLPPPNNDQVHGFVYSGASFTTLEVPGASGGAAYGINNVGQIVGTFVDGTGTHGFLHTNGNFTRFDVPGAFETEAKAINDLGQIVGEFGTPSNGTTVMHGFFRDTNGRLTTFDPLGESSTFATGINKSAQIVGHN